MYAIHFAHKGSRMGYSVIAFHYGPLRDYFVTSVARQPFLPYGLTIY